MEGNRLTYESRLPQKNVDSFNVKEFVMRCLDSWYIFLISIFVCLCIAGIHLLKTPKLYSRYSMVLIKETYARRQSNDLESMLSAGGVSQMSSRLANEIVAIKSPDLMREVVKRLSLDVIYYRAGAFHDFVLYGRSLPVSTKLLSAPIGSSFSIERDGDAYKISKIAFRAKNGEYVKDDVIYTGHPSDTLWTAIGGIVLQENKAYEASFDFPIKVVTYNPESLTQMYADRLSATEVNAKNMSNVLQIMVSDQSPSKAEDILRMLINVYNENWVDDRNKVAVSTSMFINDRLLAIEKELGAVDSDISSYKSRNLIPDIQAVSGLYLSETNELTRQIQDLNNQIYTAKFVRNFLSNAVTGKQMIPVTSGMADLNVSNQISEYNRTLLERNKLAAGSSESNPLVRDKDSSLESIRQAILSSIDSQVATLEAQVNQLQLSEQSAASRLAESPKRAKDLLGVERQQKVKENLYLFLLQKREENELSQAFTAYNTRVITQPCGPSGPTSPIASRNLLVAFVIGFLIPLLVIYLKMALDTKIRTRNDIEHLTIPFLGEIPQHYHSGQKKPLLPWKKPFQEEVIVVKQGKRDSVNEAFRVLRTNVEFVCKGSEHSVISISSFNPGSGKTFTTINLALAVAIKGAKVVLVDADLRHASLSKYVGSPSEGIVSYVSGSAKDVDSLMCHPEGKIQIDVLPVGKIPPNPSEIVADVKFEEMIQKLKAKYEYVLIDCPPVEIVADAHIVNNYVDRTVFVIRAGLLEKQMLMELENYYVTSKFKNIGLVLNGTEAGYTKYYSHRYGYYNSAYSHYYSKD